MASSGVREKGESMDWREARRQYSHLVMSEKHQRSDVLGIGMFIAIGITGPLVVRLQQLAEDSGSEENLSNAMPQLFVPNFFTTLTLAGCMYAVAIIHFGKCNATLMQPILKKTAQMQCVESAPLVSVEPQCFP